MRTTRRQFIKRSAAAISITMLAPRYLLGARSTHAATPGGHPILVLLQLNGGNDGFNTVVPYSDPHYHSARPTLGFSDAELANTIINSDFALHPSLKPLKDLYDQGKLAAVLGVGYPNQDLSHAISSDIWQTANINNGAGFGWLGRYADAAFDSTMQLPAAAIGAQIAPKIISAAKARIPLVLRIGDSAFKTTLTLDRDIVIKAFRDLNARDFPADQLIAGVAQSGAAAERNGGLIDQAVASYHSTVQYNDNNPAAKSLKTAAILLNAFPDATVLHVSYPGAFDNHAFQIGSTADAFTNRLIGTHANEMQRIAEAIKSFMDDLTELGLADNVILMTYSEFGRRLIENASHGSDHGAASHLLVVGNKVKGGNLYGAPPSLDPMNFDTAGNVKFTTDFRSVLATLLDRWMPGGDSQTVLGGTFPLIDFL